MTNGKPSSGMSFENIRNIEAELFARKHKSKAPAGNRKPEEAGTSRDTWRLNQEILDAKKENAALKYELDAARVLLTEQNVLTVSSISALKELKEDLAGLKALLRDREADLADLGPEIFRLNSEVKLERKRNMELMEKLAREAALREDLQKRRTGPAKHGADGKTEVSAAAMEADFLSITGRLREERPRRFVNKHY